LRREEPIYVDEASPRGSPLSTSGIIYFWSLAFFGFISLFLWARAVEGNDDFLLIFYLWIISTTLYWFAILWRIHYNFKKKYKNNFRFVLYKRQISVIIMNTILGAFMVGLVISVAVIGWENWTRPMIYYIILICGQCLSSSIFLCFTIYFICHPEFKKRKYISWEEYLELKRKIKHK
jgi:hypothetical protein